MFDVGVSYEFRVIEGGDEMSFTGVVKAYLHPILQLEDLDIEALEISFISVPGDMASKVKGPSIPSRIIPGRIMNITSPNFISAVARPKR